MQIRGVVLQRGGLVYRVAAARLEILYIFTRHEKSPWAVVGAYPVGLGDGGQHGLLGWEHRLPGWVERRAPRFGAVHAPRDEHYRGRSLAVALHVHLASPADVDQTREILVSLGGVALGRVALGGVVAGARASGERRGRSTMTKTDATSNITFFDTLPPDLVEGGQEAPSRTLTRRQLATLGTQPTLSVGSAYRPDELALYEL